MDSKKLIKRIIDIAYKAKEGHIASSLSILDILYVLYDKILNNEHHFILSKGHASLGLYVILEHFNLLEENLDDFCKMNGKLGGHPNNKIKNIEASTGSLGHGLPMAVGIAMGEKIKKTNIKTFVIIGDGESNEGTNWESALLASNHKLDNLVCILDYNHSNDRALKLDNLKNKFESFNWDVIEINGHSIDEITKALSYNSDKPLLILANTIKGKGIPFMENNPEWHHKAPNEDEYNKIQVLFSKYEIFDELYASLNTIGQTFEEAANLAKITATTNILNGDIAEVGVYAGDTAKVIENYNNNRNIYLFDTFEGLKDCSPEDGTYLENGFFEYDYELVKNKFKLNSKVFITKGYFPESGKEILSGKTFSMVHLDVDTYQSTLNSLIYFYDKVEKNGFIVVHDYINNPQTTGVTLAVNEFFTGKDEVVNTVGTTQAIILKK
jgi:transketolase